SDERSQFELYRVELQNSVVSARRREKETIVEVAWKQQQLYQLATVTLHTARIKVRQAAAANELDAVKEYFRVQSLHANLVKNIIIAETYTLQGQIQKEINPHPPLLFGALAQQIAKLSGNKIKVRRKEEPEKEKEKEDNTKNSLLN
ncbi:MAG: hypothetical protein EZS28_024612, partial [Streblomastix strix]